MKRIFTLAIALTAFACIASAQNYVLQVNMNDGTTKEYDVPDVTDVTFASENWEEWATGTYQYHVLWCDEETLAPVEKSGLKIYRSDFNPKRYKIKDWSYTTHEDEETGEWLYTDFYFSYDEDTGEVRAEKDQDLGYAFIYYYSGMHVEEIIDWAIEWGGIDENNPDDQWYFDVLPKSYRDEDGVFHFALVYYMGPMPWYLTTLTELDYETLTITSYAEEGAPAHK